MTGVRRLLSVSALNPHDAGQRFPLFILTLSLEKSKQNRNKDGQG
jgi:hypothetical protein